MGYAKSFKLKKGPYYNHPLLKLWRQFVANKLFRTINLYQLQKNKIYVTKANGFKDDKVIVHIL